MQILESGANLAGSAGTHDNVKASRNWGMGRRKSHQRFLLRHGVIAAAVLSCMLLAASRCSADGTPDHDNRVEMEIMALGKQGEAIQRARDQVLDILQHNNACTAWFQEADSDPAGVFRSLHFELEKRGTSYVYSRTDNDRRLFFKQPWGAKSFENGGRNSVIELNANGAFFNRASPIMQLDQGGGLVRPAGTLQLVISSYRGKTQEAQIVILLHELGHIIGRLPEDGDSWDGRSSRNTSELMRHCKNETNAAAHNNLRSSN